jgi:predicted acetyltransferase
VPVAGITAVSVAASHRRRGILRSMMAFQLDDIAARGEAVAMLTASESGIYRRFGYGMASFNAQFELDPRTARFREPVGDGLDIHLTDGPGALDAARAVYDTWRLTRPGAYVLDDGWWQALLGPQETYIGGGKVFVAMCEPGAGHGGGFAVYTTAQNREFDLIVRMLVANDPVVEARLWRYLLEVDLVSAVKVELVPVDCPLRWWLTDPRRAETVRLRDWLHARILDVPTALAARRYATDGELVVEVVDDFRPGPATGGRFALAVRDGEGVCAPTTREPDLALDVAELGSLYLGGVRATELAQACRIDERTTGALARADALFTWPVAPFCPTHF